MPAKIARSAARPPFGVPEMLVAVHTSRLSCREAEKAPVFTPAQESSGESKIKRSFVFKDAGPPFPRKFQKREATPTSKSRSKAPKAASESRSLPQSFRGDNRRLNILKRIH